MPDKNTFLALLNLVIENKDEKEGRGKQKKKTSDYSGKKTRPIK